MSIVHEISMENESIREVSTSFTPQDLFLISGERMTREVTSSAHAAAAELQHFLDS